MNIKIGIMTIICILLALEVLVMPIAPALASSQIDILGPSGSGQFGHSVTVLPNGNFVVCDPQYNDGSADVGAVYLYDGASAEQISMLTGSTSGDSLCSNGVTVLANGNYVVSSPEWDNGTAENAGAVTWGDGMSGISGTVSQTNSLVGSTAGDQIGWGVYALVNGNYVVSSQYWDNEGAADAGAVTWGDGMSGTTGVVNAANSLVGSTAGDFVSDSGVFELSNGNYVVSSYAWDNQGVPDAGAVTWGDGASGTTGVVSAGNSLVGSTAGDYVSDGGVYALVNGNYVVSSYAWDNEEMVNAGAVTWVDGTSGITGTINDTNSIVGSAAYNNVGRGGVYVLSNGNYVVSSLFWDNEGVANVGAATWGDGASGIMGVVSADNSLVGSTANDRVGILTELSSGNYVVRSPAWDNKGAVDAGAATWGDGASGITGEVSPGNSLVGTSAGDCVGISITVLSNNNYVVSSQYWDNKKVRDTGAVTWGDGARGVSGTVSEANSLVGSTDDDRVGSGGVTALSNGNYVVRSYRWDNEGTENAGAVTWGDGMSGITGIINDSNSLVGSTTGDQVGMGGVTALSNGNYVVSSYLWDNEGVVNAGAVTLGDGASGTTGVVSADSSLVGSATYDDVGKGGVTALSNGNYVVRSPFWDNEGVVDAGAVTWGDGASGITGVVSEDNSLVGSTVDDFVGYDGVYVLSNSNYVVRCPLWDNEGILDAGAVTWGDGTSGIKGTINDTNSLVGSTSGDLVGLGGVYVLSNGNSVVSTPLWDNEGILDAGAVTWGDGTPLSNGPLDFDNSVMGTTISGGKYLNFAYDEVNMQLVVGRPYDNIVTLFRLYNMPVADAGPDQSVLSGASVTLDGSASYDPDGDLPLVFNWEQSGGIPVSLSGSDTVEPTFTAPTVLETSTLTFMLVVSDSLGNASLPDEVVITVSPPNLAPVADAGPNQSVLSNDIVTLDGSASYDSDGDLPLAFNWEQTSGMPVLLSDSDSAHPTFTAPMVEETSTLTFTLVVRDSLGYASLPDEVVITVSSYKTLLPMVLK